MAIETHILRGYVATFGLLALLSLIEGAISAHLIDVLPGGGSVYSRSGFLVFVSWWTFLFSILYLVAFFRKIRHGATSVGSHAIWIFVTWVFITAGAAAITDALRGGLDCPSGNNVCNTLNAEEAFAWLMWIVITLQLFSTIFITIRAHRESNTVWGPIV